MAYSYTRGYDTLLCCGAENLPLIPEGVEVYAGFTEHAYRLLFAYEDHFKTEPIVKTILPSGASENSKVCKPVKGKALIGYVYTQNISEVAAQQHEGDPCVWQRKDGTYAVVQVWSANYNDEFKQTFQVTSANPDTSKFKREAVQEFHQAMVGIFGEAARERSVLFCSKSTHNPNVVYVGDAEKLFHLLLVNPIVQDDLKLERMLSDGFVAKVENRKGEKSTKPFTFSPGVKYALYTKAGYDTLACITPFDQFIEGRVFHEQLESYKMLTNEGVEELPRCFIDEDVCALDKEYKKDCIAQGIWRKPLPMHMVAGPALKWAWIACGTVWVSVLIMFLCEYYFGHCEDGAWISPEWIWAVFCAFGISRLFLEYKAMRYFFLAFAKENQYLMRMPCNGSLSSYYHFSFNFLSRHSISARAWLILTLVISINNIVDPLLDAVSTALIVRNTQCGEAELDLKIWTTLMSSSMLSKLFDPSIWEKVTLPRVAMVCFIAMFSQLLYPLITSSVCSTPEERAQKGPISFELSEDPHNEVRWTAPAKRCFPKVWKATYHESLQVVGFAAGLSSVNSMFPCKAIAEVKLLLNDEKDGYELRVVRRVNMILGYACNMMFLQVFLENSFSLQIQSIAFFCHYEYSHRIQYGLLFSILSSIAHIANEVVRLGMPALRISWQVHRQIEMILQKGQISSEIKQRQTVPYNELVWEELASVYKKIYLVVVIKFVCLVSVTYAILRMFFNFFICEDGLWNVNGCVTLSNL